MVDGFCSNERNHRVSTEWTYGKIREEGGGESRKSLVREITNSGVRRLRFLGGGLR